MNRKIIISVILAGILLTSGCNGESVSDASNTSNSNADSITSEINTDQTGESSEVTDNNSSGESTSKKDDGVADGVMTNGQVIVKMRDHYWGMSLYGGGTGNNYAGYLNEFKQKVGSSVNVFNMVVPTSGEYYMPDMYSEYNASQLDSINNITNQLSGVITIDGYGALKAHTDEDIYTRTDHHWTSLGAYYAAQEFAKMAQVDFKELSEYEKETIDGYVGSLYTFTQDANLLNDPEVFTFYRLLKENYTAKYYTTDFQEDYDSRYLDNLYLEQPVNSSYSIIMGGDEKIVKTTSNSCKNNRKLVVFKDSYGNAEIPFLVSSFEEVYVCDIRYFDINAIDFIKEQGITDVLFTMCTFSAVGDNAEGIKEMME